MAVREFRSVDGKEWRAWEIRPEAIHPVTRAEDYLSDCFVVGWLVFETTSGDEKRRLCPYPKAWDRATDAQLAQLLQGADAVPARKLMAERQVAGDTSGRTQPVDLPPEDDKLDVTDLPVVRSFKYPGGRLWTVCVVVHPEDGGAPALRFTAGSRYLDMRPWPRDWVDAPDEKLVELIRIAAPRPVTPPPAGGSRRRYNDPPPQYAESPQRM
jgi:hypothetical protein